MLEIDLRGKRAFVAGVADASGLGHAAALAFAEAGASVCLGVWPPALGGYEKRLARGKFDAARRLSDGGLFEPERIYALDASFDSTADSLPARSSDRRYANAGDCSIDGVAARLVEDFGAQPLDIIVHSLANAPEITHELLGTSRAGYLAAVSTSAYSLVSMVQRWGPLLRAGSAICSLSYLASQRVIAGYGGGMHAAKAALESDTRVLAFEAGRRWRTRVNTVSAGPVATRAASATGVIDQLVTEYEQKSPLGERLRPAEVARVIAFLCSPLASAITGTTLFADHGYHAMGFTGDIPRDGDG